MARPRRRLLLVSHEATRTGAPRIALEILEALREAPNLERVTLLRGGGPLTREFAARSDLLIDEPMRRVRARLVGARRTRRVGLAMEGAIARAMLARLRPDVVYLNTVKAACYARPALRRGAAVVLHVHELEPLASSTLARYDLGPVYGRIRLVACSQAARKDLERMTGEPAERIALIPSLVDGARVRALADEAPARTSERIVTVGGCGTADQCKGVDLWLEAVQRARELDPTLALRARWIGRKSWTDLTRRASELGFAWQEVFVGEVSNPYGYMAGLDIFALSSRTDAFPLVVLEAMALGRAIVAFDVGGVREQLGDTGILVPPGDVEAMARAVVNLAHDAAARRRLGERAAARFEEVFGIERFRACVLDLVERVSLGAPEAMA